MAKKSKSKKENVVEREYVIPLGKEIRKVPRYRKTEKAVKAVKEFLARHMKIYDRDLNKIKIDKYLNEFLWARGIKNPMRKVKVKAVKNEEGIVRVELVDYPAKLKFKKAREEKLVKSAEEISKKKKEEKKASEETEKKPEEENKEEEKEKAKEGAKEMQKIQETQGKQMQKLSSELKEPKHQQRKALAK